MISNVPDREAIARLVDERAADYVALADRVWAMPELRFEEHRSAAEHLAALEREGFRVTRDIAGIATAFSGEAGSGGPVIGILGEFDALAGLSQDAGLTEPRTATPGANGHGCGHNLLGSAALLAAVAVKSALERAGLPGTVRYYGCPAEEGGSGKTYMARAGIFDDLDAAITWHPGVFTMTMTQSSLANVQAYFRFEGRASHAAASPELGRSALDAVELMNVGVNFLREHMPSDARIHYAITNAGGVSPNVVQAQAEVLYLVRSPDVADAKALFERVKKNAEGAALMTETTMTVEIDRATSNILRNRTLEGAMTANLAALGPPPFDAEDFSYAEKLRVAAITEADIAASARSFGQPIGQPKALHDGIAPVDAIAPVMAGSTDVGDVSWVTPTVQCWTACYAIGTQFHTWQMVTQGKQPAAHKGMILAAKAMATTAGDLLRDADLVARARAELAEATGGKPYACPMPAGIMPPKGALRQRSA